MADLDIDGDRVTEDDLESDSESVERNVLTAVKYFFNYKSNKLIKFTC